MPYITKTILKWFRWNLYLEATNHPKVWHTNVVSCKLFSCECRVWWRFHSRCRLLLLLLIFTMANTKYVWDRNSSSYSKFVWEMRLLWDVKDVPQNRAQKVGFQICSRSKHKVECPILSRSNGGKKYHNNTAKVASIRLLLISQKTAGQLIAAFFLFSSGNFYNPPN